MFPIDNKNGTRMLLFLKGSSITEEYECIISTVTVLPFCVWHITLRRDLTDNCYINSNMILNERMKSIIKQISESIKFNTNLILFRASISHKCSNNDLYLLEYNVT
jgi:hypothetical protein